MKGILSPALLQNWIPEMLKVCYSFNFCQITQPQLNDIFCSKNYTCAVKTAICQTTCEEMCADDAWRVNLVREMPYFASVFVPVQHSSFDQDQIKADYFFGS